MLPVLWESPPESDHWLHEIKHDGYRTQLHVAAEARVFTRNGYDWTDKYQPLANAALTLSCTSAIIDGEVIVPDGSGKSDFHALRSTISQEPRDLMLMAFDLLELDGRDLRQEPLEDRRSALEQLLGHGGAAERIRFSEGVIGNGVKFYEAVDRMGLEGMVSKRVGSTYRSGPSRSWVKTKCFEEMELVVVGVETGDRGPVALLARSEDDHLSYIGGAMVALAQPYRDQFWKRIGSLTVHKPAIDAFAHQFAHKAATWVRPEMQVRVRTLRGEERLRHATVREVIS